MGNQQSMGLLLAFFNEKNKVYLKLLYTQIVKSVNGIWSHQKNNRSHQGPQAAADTQPGFLASVTLM